MFTKAANGNAAAYAYLFSLFECISLADDLYDKDVDLREDAIARLCYLFSMMLANPFCRAHGEALSALMSVGALSWDLSNDMPDQAEQGKYVYQVVFFVASVCGGYDLARELEAQWAVTPGDSHGVL
jgi:hypothetical protein